MARIFSPRISETCSGLKSFLMVLFLIFGASSAFAHGDELHPEENVYSSLVEGVEACLSLDSGRDECYASLCESKDSLYICANEMLAGATIELGAETSMRVWTRWSQALFLILP